MPSQHFTSTVELDELPEGYKPKVRLPKGYKPSAKEDYMCEEHQEYFRRKLMGWRGELLKESEETLESLQEGGQQEADLADRASAEMEP